MQPGPHIALIGPKRSGKSTVAQVLVDHYGYHCASFATPIKDLSFSLVSYALAVMQDDDSYDGEIRYITRKEFDENKDALFVRLLQWVGDEFGRQFLGDDKVWINHLLERTHYTSKPIVIDDLRYYNEYEAMRENGCLIVRLVRPATQRAEAQGDEAVAARNAEHASEKQHEHMLADVHIYNEQTLDKLILCAHWLVDFRMWVQSGPDGIVSAAKLEFARMSKGLDISINNPSYYKAYMNELGALPR